MTAGMPRSCDAERSGKSASTRGTFSSMTLGSVERRNSAHRAEARLRIAAAYKDPKGVFDKEGTVQFLRDSFDFCTKALAEITPEKVDALTAPLIGRERLWACFTHTAHHRGRAEVYLRIKNIKPPDYRF